MFAGRKQVKQLPERSKESAAAPPPPAVSLCSWDEEALVLIAKDYESALEQETDRKKSAEQRATSILAGSAVALTLMFTVTTIALNVKGEVLNLLQERTTALIAICFGVVFLVLSNIFFVLAVWKAAHTLRPRTIMTYKADSYRALETATRKALLVDKIESLSKAALEWDKSASGSVEDLNATLSAFKLALTFLVVTSASLASALLSLVIPWAINSLLAH